jgi:Flp pilus assembly protein TadD
MLWTLLRSAFRPQASANPLVERSLSLRRSGRLRDAESTLREAALNFPDDPVVATNLGVVLLEQDAGDEGVQWLQRALALDVRCAPAH